MEIPQAAFDSILNGPTPAPSPAGGATPGQNDTPPPPPPLVVPVLPDAPPTTSLDVPDQVPRTDDQQFMSEEEKYEAARLAAETPPAPPADGDTPPAPEAPPVPGAFDETKYFEEKTGGKFKTWDEVNAAIEKAPIEVIKAPEIADPTAKKVYDALAAGKLDEVMPILEQQQFIRNIEAQPAEAVLAARIKEQFPSLTPEQVAYEISTRYAVNESEFDGNEMGLSVAKAKATDRMNADVAEAKTYFTSKLSDIKFPDLLPAGQQTNTPPAPDVDSPEAIKALAFVNALPEAKPIEKISFTHKSDSPENPITVAGDILLPQDKLAEIKTAIGAHPDKYILNRFFTKDGEFREDVFAQAVYTWENLTSIVEQAAGQSLSQTQIEMLKRAKNYVPRNQTPAGGFDQTEQQQVNAQWESFFRIPPKQVGSPV